MGHLGAQRGPWPQPQARAWAPRRRRRWPSETGLLPRGASTLFPLFIQSLVFVGEGKWFCINKHNLLCSNRTVLKTCPALSLQLSQGAHLLLYKRRALDATKFSCDPTENKKKNENTFFEGSAKPSETFLRAGQMSMNCKRNYIWSCGIGLSC